MSSCVNWTVVAVVPAENREAWEALAAEMAAATEESEPGTLIYEWFWNEAGDRSTVVERYADSGAGMVHLGNLQAKFLERMSALGEVVQIDFYGPASEELRAAMSEFGAVFHSRFAGFGR